MPDSKNNKFITIIASIVFLSIIIIPQNAEAKIHQNNQYGFQIEYPDNWYYDNPLIYVLPNTDEGSVSIFLAKFQDGINWWNHQVTVTLTTNDYFTKNFVDDLYINEIKKSLQESCTIANWEVEGYTCSNYSVIDSKITEIDKTKAYQIKDSWTEKYPDNTTANMIGILTDIIVDDDVWTISSTNDATMYLNNTEIIHSITNSFKFIEITEPIENLEEIVEKIPDKLLTPLKQFKSGTLANDIECKKDMILMIKNNGNPACLSPSSAEKLESKGWGTRA